MHMLYVWYAWYRDPSEVVMMRALRGYGFDELTPGCSHSVGANVLLLRGNRSRKDPKAPDSEDVDRQ
jgi:hypothetical protein